MGDHDTAQELEHRAAREPVHPAVPTIDPSLDDAMAALVRRGFHDVSRAKLDLPFDPDAYPEALQQRFVEALRHYAFRLFLRGAIQHPEGFAPDDATRFLGGAPAREMCETLRDLGLATADGDGRYRLTHPPNSFGSTLEWYVGRELERRLRFTVSVGVKFHAPGVGGDLDVVAVADGRLVYVELKSSPPKHLSAPEVGAFFDRLRALRPDVAVFAVDTALRLGDRVVPLLDEVRAARGRPGSAARVDRELWALTPHVWAVNARPDLFANVARAIAEGLRALSPDAP
ncbi:MAG: hypothetical protein U0324_42420 [Polyangiales bacterium]